MSQQFNPPPGWPTPPAGWRPDENWQPDPSWPPAPPGWQFWIPTAEAPTHEPSVREATTHQAPLHEAPTQQMPAAQESAPAIAQPQTYPPNQVPVDSQPTSSGSRWPIVVIAVAGVVLVGALIWLAISLITGSGASQDTSPAVTQPSATAPASTEPATPAPSQEPTTEATTPESVTTPEPTDTESVTEAATSAPGGVGDSQPGDLSLGRLDEGYDIYQAGQPAPLLHTGDEIGTITLLSVDQEWEPEPDALFCQEPEHGRLLALEFEVSVHDEAERYLNGEGYYFSPIDMRFYGPEGRMKAEETNPWAGIGCVGDLGFDDSLYPGESDRGWVVIDGPEDIEAITVGELFALGYSGTFPAWDVRP